MKCREALQLLYDYLDRELGQADIDKIREHLAECKHCTEIYNLENRFNQLLKKKPAEDFSAIVEILKRGVLDQIHSDDQGTAGREGNPPFFLFRRPVWGVVSLVLVAVVSLFLYFSQSNRTALAGVFEPFIKEHQLALAGQVAMDIETIDPSAIDSCLSRRMPLPKQIFVADTNCHPRMARIIADPQRPFAQIVYDVFGRDVSVFVSPLERFSVPEEIMQRVPERPNSFTFNLDSQTVIAWKCRQYWYFIIGNLDDQKFARFIEHFN